MGRGVRREFAQAPHVADQSPTQSAHFSVSRPHRSIVETRDVIKFAFHSGEGDGVTGGLSLLNQAVNLLPGDAGFAPPARDVVMCMMKARQG